MMTTGPIALTILPSMTFMHFLQRFFRLK
jgi:hypothetical protein